MATKRDAVKGAQLLIRKEKPGLVADGLWGVRTEKAYQTASPQLQQTVVSFLEREGWNLARVRQTTSVLSISEQIVVERAQRAGITGTSLANFLATLKAESRFKAVREDHRYSYDGVRRAKLSALYPLSVSQLSALVSSGAAAFFEMAYGHMTSVGKMLGNREVGDGGRYYGRGMIQLTGRSAYEQYSRDTGSNAINDPDILVRSEAEAIDSAIWYWLKIVGRSGADMRLATRRLNAHLPSGQVEARVHLARQYETALA